MDRDRTSLREGNWLLMTPAAPTLLIHGPDVSHRPARRRRDAPGALRSTWRRNPATECGSRTPLPNGVAGPAFPLMVVSQDGSGHRRPDMTALRSTRIAGISMCRVVLALAAVLMHLLGAPAASAGPAPAALVGLEGAVICHSGGDPADHHPSRPPCHDHACLLCQACALAMPAIPLPSSDVPPPASAQRQHSYAAHRQATTGPPRVSRAATPPTGPPAHRV